jgi:hypothetical protein
MFHSKIVNINKQFQDSPRGVITCDSCYLLELDDELLLPEELDLLPEELDLLPEELDLLPEELELLLPELYELPPELLLLELPLLGAL